jgi:uncharacterized protein DUF6644
MTPMGAIEMSALGVAMRQWLWLYPIVEIVHLSGIALLFGSIAVLDLRLLGLSSSVPVRRLAAHILPWTAASFLLIVPSGLAMFVAHAGELIGNPVFVLKVCLILGAGVNAAVFHAGAFRGAADWDVNRAPPAAARIAAGLSLLLWLSVIACGRLLAYT